MSSPAPVVSLQTLLEAQAAHQPWPAAAQHALERTAIAVACTRPVLSSRLSPLASPLGRHAVARARLVVAVLPVSAAASGPVTAALVQRRAGVPPQAAELPGHWFRPPVVGTHEPERQRLLCPHHPPPKGQSGGHRLRPCHGFPSPPLPPRGGLCGGARRVRWVALLALQPGTASAVLRGAPIPDFCPPPTPEPSPCSGSSRKTRAACAPCARRQRSRCPPGGAQAAGNPSPGQAE